MTALATATPAQDFFFGQSKGVAHEAPEPVVAPKKEKFLHAELQKREGRAGENWLLRLGIMVADKMGCVRPMHVFLQEAYQEFLDTVSDFRSGGNIWNVEALQEVFENTIIEASEVIESPVECPENYATLSAIAMLWGNFTDLMVATLDELTASKPRKICIDLNTVAPVSVSFSTCKADVDDAVPRRCFYAIYVDPNNESSASTVSDGQFSPNFIWALQNALNLDFSPGDSDGEQRTKARYARDRMIQFIREVGSRFHQRLSDAGVSIREFVSHYNGQPTGRVAAA